MTNLDIGCGGNGEFVDWGNQKLPLSSVDVSVDIRLPLERRAGFTQASAEALPFRDSTFDLVRAFDVIEHVERPGDLVREAKRVLRPGGRLVIGTPNATYAPRSVMAAFRGMYGSDADHIAVWGKPELEHLLKRVGFSSFSVRTETYLECCEVLPRWHYLVVKLCPFESLRARQLVARCLK